MASRNTVLFFDVNTIKKYNLQDSPYHIGARHLQKEK